jgi:hypothetical protein
MSENKQDSGADAPEQISLEKNLKEGNIKLFLDSNLEPALTPGTFKYHLHPDRIVPKRPLRLWRKRGFKPLEKGVAHVWFENSEKKYTFPAYFQRKKFSDVNVDALAHLDPTDAEGEP